MKKICLALLASLCFTGCFINERGIGNRFYSDCRAYYDASGTYREDCPKNWLDLPLTPVSLYKKLVTQR